MNASQHVRRLVHEVDDIGRLLARVGTVQPGQGLHGLDATQLAIDVHRAQQRLVEARLKLVRHQQDAELGRGEGLPNIPPAQPGFMFVSVNGSGPVSCRQPLPRTRTSRPIG